MTCMKQHAIETNLSLADKPAQGAGDPGRAAVGDLKAQCLRILRCTARSLASSPGGLRFKAGTRPWLEGLSGAWPAGACAAGRRKTGVFQIVSD